MEILCAHMPWIFPLVYLLCLGYAGWVFRKNRIRITTDKRKQISSVDFHGVLQKREERKKINFSTISINQKTSESHLKDHLSEKPSNTSNIGEKKVTAHVPSTDSSSEIKGDDLTKIIGIGPKIATILKSANICYYKDILNSDSQDLKAILLEVGGSRYKMNDPSGWKRQAELAKLGLWQELQELQDKMVGAGSSSRY